MAALALFSLALNSCYFNSAGFITDAASHQALMSTGDLTQGQCVYTNGTDYYVEMPHYRFDSPVRLQYKWLWEKVNRDFYNIHETYDTSARCTEKSGKVMLQVPADFGRFLTGESTAPFAPDGMVKMAEDPDAVRKMTRKPVVQIPSYDTFKYEYTSPNSGWLYTAAVFDWLVVDLPITLTQNALMSVAFCLVLFSKGMEGVEPPSGNYGNSDYEAAQRDRDRMMENQAVWDRERNEGR